MKRIIISVILLAICIGAAAVEMYYINIRADYYLDRIEQVDKFMLKNDFESALPLCKDIDKSWSSTAEKINTMLIHDYIDDISLSIAQMRSHIESSNPDMYFAESSGAKKGLASMKNGEFLSLENIL